MIARWNRHKEDEGPVLDTGYLDRLAGHLGHGPVCELLADGMFELGDRLDRLEDAAGANALEEAANLAHAIAGVAGHLGLTRLAARSVAASRALRDKPGVDAAAVVRPVTDCKALSIDALHCYAKTAPAREHGH